MNANVTIIPARRKTAGRLIKTQEKPKLRVAAYCRVSTDSEEQAGSYEIQVQHYKDYIGQNKEWECVDIYTDDGISGTNTKKRDGFNKMIDDCLAGKIDIVLTKSISRFARNTIDCLKYVRMLKDKRVAIIFEKENINTLEASGELLLTIMASLAQQKSASLSQNIKLGLQFRYQDGQVIVNHNHFLGYTKDENGNLIVDEEQAKIVRRIYREYLEGASFLDIAKGLEQDGILTGGKRKKWHKSTIQGILQNEKYIGDALLQKTVTVDFIEKKRIKNDGSIPQYYVKDSHEAIIPRDIFIQVQEEIARRAHLLSGEKDNVKRVYSSKYALSNLCKCSKCGDYYRRATWNIRGRKQVVWRCSTRMLQGPTMCDALNIAEDVLQQVTIEAINKLLSISPSVKRTLLENIKAAIVDDNSSELERVNQQLADKQSQLVKLAHAKKDYSLIADEIYSLREQRQQILNDNAKTEAFKNRITELEQYLNQTNGVLLDYDEKLVRRYIDLITAYDDKYIVKFKAGVEIEMKR